MQLEIQIAAPTAEVFAQVLDVARWPQMISAIIKIEMLTEGPVAVGTRFRETRIMFGREATEEMTFAEIAAPHRFVLTAASNGAAYRATHLFEPHDNGTRLTMHFVGKPQTLLARLLTPLGWLMAGSVRKAMAGDLADLKRAIEARPTTT